MATYLYYCPQCNKKMEVCKGMDQSGKDENCPECRQTMQRVYTAPGIQIKGAPVHFEAPACSGDSCSCSGCSGGNCAEM